MHQEHCPTLWSLSSHLPLYASEQQPPGTPRHTLQLAFHETTTGVGLIDYALHSRPKYRQTNPIPASWGVPQDGSWY